MQAKMKSGPEKKLKPRGFWGSMCKPAPQTPGAGTTNKSYFICFDIFTFVNALHYSWGGDDKQDIVVTVTV